ncbi:MAG TPA: transporter, partial [Spirochaetia bacterium]
MHDTIESTLETFDIATGARHIIYTAREHFEAPNWSRDGGSLFVNKDGRIYRIPVAGSSPERIETGPAVDCNNDHGLSPDGSLLAISNSDNGGGSRIYLLPSKGGEPRLVTKEAPSYWHGWSPDGRRLAYCAQRDGVFGIFTIGVDGSGETRLTTAQHLDDGPDYAPDGRFIYFNSDRTGLMKIWRMKPDGREPTQMTFGAAHNDWFAHPSPDGKWLVFLSYGTDVQGHPPNK